MFRTGMKESGPIGGSTTTKIDLNRTAIQLGNNGGQKNVVGGVG